MAYFPMFIDLTDRPCLIVGGGSVAARKAEKLLPYGPRITLVAPEFCPALEAMAAVRLLRRPYQPRDIEGMALVIAASDNTQLNRAVSAACQAQNIPVNAVDDKSACSFLFPCLVREGELSVGISTGGASPTAAIWLKEQIGALIPPGMEGILRWLEEQRPAVKAAIPEEKTRAALFAALFAACMARGAPLSGEELARMLEEYV